MGSKYSFGNDLRDAISIGKSIETPLRKYFEHIFLKKTGINILFSEFTLDLHLTNKDPHLFLYISFQDNHKKLLDFGCHKYCNIFYPNDQFHQDISSCLNEAVKEFGVAPIHLSPPPQTSIHISDFYSTAQSIYFDLHMLEIDRAARAAFPEFSFALRLRLSDTEHYYLIFESDEILKKAQEATIVEPVIQFVDAYCKEHAPLHIFDGFEIRPEVTSKTALQSEGRTMGIMRNNTQFNKL